jgi:hypothetical protein
MVCALQLIPTTFHYAVSTMAKTLDPSQPGKDVSCQWQGAAAGT